MKNYRGLSASSGVVEAQALVIKNPMIAPKSLEGDYIVVAEYTTPNLNMLLMNAKGIVCSVGGLTMHASVIARELGIPCVVSVKGIMDDVKTGDLIQLDGSKGEVQIYE